MLSGLSKQDVRPWRTYAFGASLAIVVVLSACASVVGDAAGVVKQRAEDRWSALVRGEFMQAYTYSTPAFRAVVTLDGYRNRFGGAVKWVGSEVIRVDCPEAVKCDVTVRVDYKPIMLGRVGGVLSTHVDETWLLEDGQWWLFQPLT